MAPTNYAFFNRTGLERIGVVGLEPGLLLGWSISFGSVLLCKDEKEEGPAGVRPWPLRCLSQFLPGRKDRLLRGRMFLHTFHRGGGLIYSVCVPNWMIIRILSHWMGCKTREKSNFLKKGKTVILVKIQNFSRSRMTKRTSSLESSHEI